MRRFILSAILVSGISCANQAMKARVLGTDYLEASVSFDHRGSFGFDDGHHKYVFSVASEMSDKFSCSRYYVFKDGKLTYKMPYDKVYSIFSAIYKSLIPLEAKIQQAAGAISKISPQDFECDAKSGTSNEKHYSASEIADQALTLIVYSPALILAVPIVIPMEIINDRVDAKFERKLSQIRLGMSLDQVNRVMDEDVTDASFPPYLIQQMQTNRRKLVFAYRDKTLRAFVWTN